MSKKSILFISQYFYPENFKGNDLVFELQSQGYKITVLTGKPNYPTGSFYKGYSLFNRNYETINGVAIYRLPLISRGKGRGLRLLLNYCSFFLSAFIFYLLKRKKVDVDIIITQQLSPLTSSIPAVWFKNYLKKPLITWTLDLWPESVIATTSVKDGYIIKYLDKLSRYLYHNSDVILVSSNAFVEFICKKGISISKVVHFPNWADAIFENQNENLNFPMLPTGFNVVFAGNLGDAQDLPSVIEAIKVLKEEKGLNFVFVGSGRYEKELRRIIQKYNLHNIFLFPQHAVEYMPSLFRKSSIMLLTLKGGEFISLTVPAKLQSYMSCAKPILAMIDGESKSIIESANCGLSSSAGDYKSLALNILQASKLHEEVLTKMGGDGKEYYNTHFSREVAMNKIISIVETM